MSELELGFIGEKWGKWKGQANNLLFYKKNLKKPLEKKVFF